MRASQGFHEGEVAESATATMAGQLSRGRRHGCWPSRGVGASASSAMELLLEFLGACWLEEEEGGEGVRAQGRLGKNA
jgi:hypothetical protein